MKFVEFIIMVFIFVPCVITANKNVDFTKYFNDKIMRIDFFHIGDSQTEIVTIDQVYQYGVWAGSMKNLIDQFNVGRYYAKIYDQKSGELIFSKGFDSYFGEYKTSAPAADGINRTYHESVLLPYPKQKIIFSLEKRNDSNELNEFYSAEIEPQSLSIIRDKVLDKSVKVYNILINGDPHSKVDVVIVGEGYTIQEEEKFKKDLEKFKKVFMNHEPYKTYQSKFNIYGVLKPSEESGVDEPRAGIFKNTTLNATFNAFNSERYLLTEDNKKLRDIAGHVPYDAIYIMVNHKRYGGGGIYNLYSTFTSDTQWNEYIFLHEFGHSFAGLADEYYTSSVAYNDFYKRGIEPVEANITALIDPEKLKWKYLTTKDVEIPTPWEKEEYDKMDYAWQKRRASLNNKVAKLKRSGALIEKITEAEQDYDMQDKEHSNKIDKYLSKSKFVDKVGAFEGAGYSSEGLYRSMLDCIMFSKGKKPFCKVCQEAIVKVINFYSE